MSEICHETTVWTQSFSIWESKFIGTVDRPQFHLYNGRFKIDVASLSREHTI